MSTLSSWLPVLGMLGSVAVVVWQVARHAGAIQGRQEYSERTAEDRHRENQGAHRDMLSALTALDKTSAVHEQRIDTLERGR